jgi:hypothetical protein
MNYETAYHSNVSNYIKNENAYFPYNELNILKRDFNENQRIDSCNKTGRTEKSSLNGLLEKVKKINMESAKNKSQTERHPVAKAFF